MLSRLFSRKGKVDTIAPFLYGVIVAQARSPALYSDFSVADTVSGRFEMVVLHLMLISRRLQSGGEPARKVGQDVFDHFCRDMDKSLRELGVGDLSVPKHMRRVGEAYYGRAKAYEPGLSTANSEALAEAVARTVFPDDSQPEAAIGLAAYAVAAAGRLEKQDENEIIAGKPDFPQVEDFAPEGVTR